MKEELNSEWEKVWDSRGQAFNTALARVPAARDEETAPLIDGLRLGPFMSLLEIGPCGGCFLKAVRRRFGSAVKILVVEPSTVNVRSLPDYVEIVRDSDISRFSLDDGQVDRVANLAGLHHSDDQSGFFSESYRVLRGGGIAGIAEVLTGSPVSVWLNTFVDQFNEFGHSGRFFSAGELRSHFEDAGFSDVSEEHLRFSWRFGSADEMAKYCTNLFYLNRASPATVLDGLRDLLGFSVASDGSVALNWELTYAFGRKVGAF